MTATILIVGYRAYDELERCLRSLARHEPEAPVVLVDHDADEARGRALTAQFPRVTYVPRQSNPGFAAGVNEGARHAGPGPLLLLNPDCELGGPLIAQLRAVLDGNPAVGVAGALVYEADGRLQASARRFPNLTTAFGGRTSWLSRIFPENPLTRRNLAEPAAAPTRVDWVSGACMLVRRDAFAAVGGFDEGFFLYWEDADFCRRLADFGWTTAYVPAGPVVHSTARASRHAPVRSLLAFHRSAFRYYWKHGSWLARLASPVVAAGLAARFLLQLPGRLRG